VYLYCFARRAVAGQFATRGIENSAEVLALPIGQVAAVFSAVSLAGFVGPSGAAHLRDASWIIPRARQHERVVEEVMQLSPVLPARFGTVLPSPATLAQLASRNAARIEEFLARMANREEWSVKAFLDVPTTEAWLASLPFVADESPPPRPASAGLRYIQNKRACLHARRHLEDCRRQMAERIEQALAPHAEEVRPLRPQPTGAPEHAGKMVFHCALLVASDHVAELQARARDIEAQYTEQGLTLSLSGPWPPYSFCPPVLDIE
jgi:hypothetical protein